MANVAENERVGKRFKIWVFCHLNSVQHVAMEFSSQIIFVRFSDNTTFYKLAGLRIQVTLTCNVVLYGRTFFLLVTLACASKEILMLYWARMKEVRAR